jgi:uncharacterized protein with ATP-grasp and redox domains
MKYRQIPKREFKMNHYAFNNDKEPKILGEKGFLMKDKFISKLDPYFKEKTKRNNSAKQGKFVKIEHI